MSHLYSLKGGDQLCPLGFHPQVRWPTRCKRCFRDYKEHGTRRSEEIASSTPSLNREGLDKSVRSWTSTQNLSTNENNVVEVTAPLRTRQRPSSWSSTPDLEEAQKGHRATPKLVEEVTVNVQLPVRRRHTATTFENAVEESFTFKRSPSNGNSAQSGQNDETVTITQGDSLAERVRKMQMMKRQGSLEREGSIPKSDQEQKSAEPQPVRRRRQTDPLPPLPDMKAPPRSRSELQPIPDGARPPRARPASTDLQPVAEMKLKTAKKVAPVTRTSSDSYTNSKDVQFLMQVKDKRPSSKYEDAQSTTTETTETTLVDRKEYEFGEEHEMLKRELETVKARCERAERDKSDILLRRLASMDTSSNKTAAAEALKLQQKVNEMSQQIEDLQDEKKSLTQKVKELTSDMKGRPSKSIEEQLRNKLEQAERMCENLMDENEDMKRELKNMESEIDEMQDNFREEQADEYVTVKKELEITTKNCRILSFKLKKSERKNEALEIEKQSIGSNQSSSELHTKIKQLEDELKVANEVARRLQAESESLNSKKKAPALGQIGKSTSDGGKVSRQSLTRGGSQEDPVQLLRDLQDSCEREADLREQLKFAEEESESLRKKSSRVEEENESLMMQLKKMATKARSRKLSPNPPKRNEVVEKDEGISDEEDTAELKLQLELNEQETAVLRRKVEELERESEFNKRQVQDMQSKMSIKVKEPLVKKVLTKTAAKADPLSEKKMQVMEDEINELRKKVIEKDRELERKEAEQSLTKGKLKIGSKLKSLETPLSEPQSVDMKRQLQVVEQEANVLRTKTQTLEQENEKLLSEVKKLQLQNARNSLKTSAITIPKDDKSKASVEELEKERDELKLKLKKILEDPVDKLSPRIPKVYSDTKTKLQLKKMIEELEEEVTEARAIAVRAGAVKLKTLEDESKKLSAELSDLRSKQEEASRDKFKNNSSTSQLKDVEMKLQKSVDECKAFSTKIKSLEEKLTVQDNSFRTLETTKMSLDYQLKAEKDKIAKKDKEVDKLKTEKVKWETKAQAAETELENAKKSSEKAKQALEKEINTLKEKSSQNDFPSRKLTELQDKNKELESSLEKEFRNTSSLTGRYELLEEEHVLFKAQLSTEKEKLESELRVLKAKVRDFDDAEANYRREKTDLQKKVSDLQRKLTEAEHNNSKTTTSTFELERSRLRAKLEEKESEFDKLTKQNEMNVDQLSTLRKEYDDLRRKLEDFERINKAQRTLNEHNATLENELKKLKVKLESSEMAIKSEVASTRLRYETQINTLQNELSSTHRQCERFKKDRDSYKQLLEAAQKNIGELKQNRKSYASTSSGDEDDKSKIQMLEQQCGCLEDELSESRLEAGKLRTELVSEKSSFEIRMSEMQSKMNVLEEERILGSSKVPGTKTRLELTWQKEREDQQRLLAETSTLARDLRQTLFEVERERDKERLESRRKIDQIKKATEEELEEGRRKISELQSDLLELRDAHAKLRTANEKLRRDRDRYDRERESGSKRKLDQVGEKKVGALLHQVDELVKIAPDLQNLSKESTSNSLSIPNPPARTKSRSPSPSGSTMQISTVLARLAEASDELRRYQRLCEDERDRERNRRSGMRRAASQENENGIDNSSGRPVARLNRSSQGSLYRKSLSLDQSIQGDQQQMIWKDSDGSMSSMQSIDSEYGIRRGDSSMDSRLSGGSTQSDMTGRRKKKKGLMGKLRSLTKGSRGAESDASQQGSDSDVSLAGDRSSKKDLKERISGIFKRAGSSSRAGSQEKILNDSQQRPISIASNGSSSGTLPPNFTMQQTQSPTPAKGKPPTPTTLRKLRATPTPK